MTIMEWITSGIVVVVYSSLMFVGFRSLYKEYKEECNKEGK